MSEWKDDLENSAADFIELVAPVLEEWSDCETVSVEQVTDERIAEELDQTAGVDS